MTNLHLERLELREIELPLKSPFETSFGRTTRRRILIVRVFDKTGASGYGECVAAEGPFYNHETVDTAWLITAKYVGTAFDTSPRRDREGSQHRARTNSR